MAGSDVPRDRRVTPEMLAQHAGPEGDVWMAIQGQVYNVTPYMDFHPGGRDELLRGAGQDATALFNEYHPWVNIKGMIDSCYVGRLVPSKSRSKARPPPSTSSLLVPPTSSTASMTPPLSRAVDKPKPKAPRTDFYDSGDKITWQVFAKGLSSDDVTLNSTDETLQVSVSHADWVWETQLQLAYPIDNQSVKLAVRSTNLSITACKHDPSQRWPSIGEAVWQNFKVLENSRSTAVRGYTTTTVSHVQQLNHNVKLITLDFNNGTCPRPALGQHVRLKRSLDHGGLACIRPYTPIVMPGLDLTQNQLQFLIKIYDEGEFTSGLTSIAQGDRLECSVSSFGVPINTEWLDSFSSVIMLAAGSGITPMLKIAQMPRIKGQLIFFNRSEADVCLEAELRTLDNITTHHVLSQPSPAWTGAVGRLSQSLLETLDAWQPGALYLVCGPHGFVQTAVGCLASMDNVHVFS
eukprot:TRINITY_DN10317_c0_g1_i3.p1 TRINITY_DN10317_c0_g1~~TRINITY_DN10317_c0_g1_i3.p1  ORF type:complete len:507 (+),score=72.76 TRINITY_DN10317_c0_g1_i3:134-1522(+)